MPTPRPQSTRPLPDNATKVFDGKLYDVYQWEQPLFDGTTATYEKLKGIDVVSVIPVTADGKVIITHQQQPGSKEYITTAGGRVEDGEDPLEAVKRELLEETGYTSDNYELWLAFQPSPRIEQALYVFIAKNCVQVTDQNLDAGEKVKIELISFDQFVDVVIGDLYNDPDVKMEFLKAKLYPEKMESLRKLLSN